jgi:hypothetical protein
MSSNAPSISSCVCTARTPAAKVLTGSDQFDGFLDPLKRAAELDLGLYAPLRAFAPQGAKRRRLCRGGIGGIVRRRPEALLGEAQTGMAYG